MRLDSHVQRSENSQGVAANLLEVSGVSKRFGGTVALRDVSFSVARGEIVALLGENGAGKSTLIKIMAGVFPADSGSLRFGEDTVEAAVRSGRIAFIHQDLGLIPWMTVAENLMLGTSYPRRLGLIDWRAGREQARRALAEVDGKIDPDDRIETLSRTDKSLVAIARALTSRAELIVLDEPTASLPQSEVEKLHVVLRRLRDRGVGMIYVSHRLDEVYALCDRVIVLRDGTVAAAAPTAGIDADALVQAIIGRPHDQVFVRPAAPAQSQETVLSLDHVEIGAVGPIDLELRAGEVVGLVGLRGAGQDAIGKALFGVETVAGGKIRLCGTSYLPRDPFDAVSKGVLMVAGDRAAESIAQGMSIRENMFLNPVASGRSLLSLRSAASEDRESENLGSAVRLRPNLPSAPIETLSGGNQQKVVMARWMRIGGKVLVLEDPTAGVDVGAKAEIYRLLNAALADGLSVLLVSTDFEEVTSICHRAYVFRSGRIVAELGENRLSIASLLNAASLSPAA
ncbi:sugar ABC transporter ATP-binding protein [Bradyrhizobium sp. WYCCWR 13023]|uniref:Sugar ABC transporter ATP-binding protein n=1 Tax=Bradyrhizobium zhengyangense TaxID=2911009 RepID=A0A9X1UBS5_9BRAD|nr:sugar ABC transporter ATP-binding protein [Bradyrhizobium zhengyangense]MCG2632475.1 sugar ABC transporter ATP-binding protein [Bradyrhizobium zhengyangense]MCG2672962.1 sugar ABC transporter ATP-binding protein [Bradyrhizobium zhengyangense]